MNKKPEEPIQAALRDIERGIEKIQTEFNKLDFLELPAQQTHELREKLARTLELVNTSMPFTDVNTPTTDSKKTEQVTSVNTLTTEEIADKAVKLWEGYKTWEQVAEILNTEGIRTPRGKLWTAQNICQTVRRYEMAA